MKVKLQLALDVLTLSEALDLTHAAGPYVDWIEVGTVLIKSEGIRAVRELKALFPDKPLVADQKVLDGGAREARLTFGAGADIITVSAVASDKALQGVLDVAAERNGQVMVDLLGSTDPVGRAQEVEALGVHCLCVHRSTDMGPAQDSTAELSAVANAVSIPIAAAGGIRLDNLSLTAHAGASIVIVGGAITKAADPAQAARTFQQTLRAGID